MGTGFDQDRGVVDDDRVRMMPPDDAGETGLFAGHAWMDDCPESTELPRMSKYDPSQGRTIKQSVRA